MSELTKNEWKCSLCTYKNAMTNETCIVCQQGTRPSVSANTGSSSTLPTRPPPPPPSSPSPSSGGGGSGMSSYWSCPRCTFLNPQVAPTCVICSDPKPTVVSNPKSGSSSKPSDPPSHTSPVPSPSVSTGIIGSTKPNTTLKPIGNNSSSSSSSSNSNNNNGNSNSNSSISSSIGSSSSSKLNQKGVEDKKWKESQEMKAPSNNSSNNTINNNNNNNNNNSNNNTNTNTTTTNNNNKEEPSDWMAEFMCTLCKKEQGYDIPCGHKLCGGCVKKHLLNGIVRQRWKKEAIQCCVGKCTEQLPHWLIKECGLGEAYQQQIEEMQKEFLISSDPTMTQCPQCKNYFATETGEVDYASKEKGNDGKPIGIEEHKHKARWRFRCSQCSAIFCGSCKAMPYHLGYTCETWKDYQEARKCRFCDKALTQENLAKPEAGSGPGLKSVCSDEACLEKRKWSCDKVLSCGHNCIGIRGERRCLSCLDEKCVGKNGATNSEEFCNICWVDPLKAAPTIRLECGHYFHFMCVWSKIDRRWPSARITFGFLNCPLCKKEIRHEAMREMAGKHFQLKEQITKDAVERLKIEGLDDAPRLKDPNDTYYNNIEKYAMDRLAFYMCSKCSQPYFGGMKACEEAGMEQEESYKQEHLVCGSCAAGADTKSCKKHGKKFITYKCKFCCSVGTWYCWGSTHFCDACHKKQEKGTYLNRLPIDQLPKCPGPANCPLGVEHPPNGVEEFSLGCVVCIRK